jgi:hypothetical protein
MSDQPTAQNQRSVQNQDHQQQQSHKDEDTVIPVDSHIKLSSNEEHHLKKQQYNHQQPGQMYQDIDVKKQNQRFNGQHLIQPRSQNH